MNHNNEIIRTDTALSQEETIQDLEGKMCHFVAIKSSLRDEDNNLIGLIGTSIEITEQKEREVELLRLERKHQQAVLEEKEKIIHLAHKVVHENDSDLLEPIKLVRSERGKKVGVLNPQKNASRAILPHIDFIKQIRGGVLASCQLPDTLHDAQGVISKPVGW